MKVHRGHTTQNLAGCVPAKSRFWEQVNRCTRDVDTARVMRHEDYKAKLSKALCLKCTRIHIRSVVSNSIVNGVFLPVVLLPRRRVCGKFAAMETSQSGFGHGHAIDTSSRTDPQRGRCEYEVESLLWQSSLTLLVLTN